MEVRGNGRGGAGEAHDMEARRKGRQVMEGPLHERSDGKQGTEL